MGGYGRFLFFFSVVEPSIDSFRAVQPARRPLSGVARWSRKRFPSSGGGRTFFPPLKRRCFLFCMSVAFASRFHVDPGVVNTDGAIFFLFDLVHLVAICCQNC